jgi:glycosyltransferase involved in cell wall biosynthesis
MRIGVMLRAMDEKQGTGIYTRNLADQLFALDRRNEYVAFHRNPANIGRYKDQANVKEILVTAPNKALWDQWAIPRAAAREKLDVIFHTKFTVPFCTARKTVMTIHGASWFVHPELYGNKLDMLYIRAMMPLYCRKADLILSNSDLTTNDFVRILRVPRAKIRTTRLGTGPQFRPVTDQSALDEVRRRYALPDKFILSVIRHDPRKNFKNLIAAFRLLRQRMPCKLVVTGLGCEQYRTEYALEEDGTAADVLFLGWVDQNTLPALYSLARCMLFPSVYEEFGIPTCEAMACGCPPVVSTTGALPEIAGDAGILVDPFNPGEIADGLARVYADDALHADLSARSLARARDFTWERCARETIAALNAL